MSKKRRIGEVLKDFREDNWEDVRKNNKKKKLKRFFKGNRKSVNQQLKEYF